MQDLNNETGHQQFSDFFTDDLPSVFSKATQGLLYRLSVFPDIQRVLSQLPRHTHQVISRPGEDVPILTEEVDERAFLCFIQAGTDTNGALWVSRIKHDILGFFCRLEGRSAKRVAHRC